MDEIVGVEIKQEQDPLEISPEQVWVEISAGIIKNDLNVIVKSEDQYCMNYDEDCSNNLPNKNGLILKEENPSLGVGEENSVNKIDIDEYEFPTHVIFKCKEDQFYKNCDEDSSDNFLSENRLVLKDYPSVEAKQSLETLEPDEYAGDVKNLVNKIDYDQQDVSGQAVFQENVELQTDVIVFKQVEKTKKGNRKISKEKKHKCHYCDYETQYGPYLKVHVSAIHQKGNTKVYCCQQCTFKTFHKPNLHRHIRLHEGKTPYECSGCGRAFNRKGHLDSHLLTNHDNLQHLITHKIHHCKFCTYKSINSKQLVHHTAQNHDGISAEKFQCHKCDYSALQKGHLKKHLLVHSNTRSYLCSVCEKRFNRKNNLDSHILSKHKENADLLKSITHKIHQCTFCSYKTINCLDKHMKSKHKQTSV